MKNGMYKLVAIVAALLLASFESPSLSMPMEERLRRVALAQHR